MQKKLCANIRIWAYLLCSVAYLAAGCGGGGGGGDDDSTPPVATGWVKTNAPAGGEVTGLMIDTTARAAGDVYATGQGGVFFLNNAIANQAWVKQNNGLPEGKVVCLGGFFGSPDVLYVGTYSDSGQNGIYFFTNGAWAARITGIVFAAGDRVEKIVAVNTSTAYAVVSNTTRTIIYKTSNNGLDWDSITTASAPATNFPATGVVEAFVVDLSVMYALIKQGTTPGVWTSPVTTLAHTWTQAAAVVYGSSLTFGTSDLFTIRNNSGARSISRSINNGVTWNPVYSTLQNDDSAPSFLAFSSASGTYLYAGIQDRNDGLYYSADPQSRATFVTKNNGLSGDDRKVTALAVTFLGNGSNHVVYRGTPINGVVYSNDSGDNYVAKNSGLENSYIYNLIVNPNDVTQVAAGTSSGFYLGTASGNTWTRTAVNTGTPFNSEDTLITSRDYDTFYVGAKLDVYRHVRTTNSWTGPEFSFASRITAMTLLANGEVLLGTDNNGLGFRNTTGVWSNITGGGLNNQVRSVAKSNGRWYAGTANGVYYSTDGSNWNLGTGGQNSEIMALAVSDDGQHLFAASPTQGLYYSSSGGLTWFNRNAGLSASGQKVYAIALINPSNGNANTFQIYLGTNDGIWYSGDTGVTWSRRVNLLTEFSIRALTFLPSKPDSLYAATSRGSVFRTTTGGQ